MSFTTTWADVLLVDKSLHCVPVSVQTDILADVAAQLSETNLGIKYDLACKYLAAHMATLFLIEDSEMPSGLITSESVGRVSRSYAAPQGLSASDPWLSSTKHGLAYARIVRNSLARMPLL